MRNPFGLHALRRKAGPFRLKKEEIKFRSQDVREIQEEIEFVKEDCLWDEAWPEKCSCLQCQELEQAFREWKMKYSMGGLR